jgi:dipeptidyl aminopeptidase/acylaminoacyl peptidase
MSGVVRGRRWAASVGLGFLIIATATASASTAGSTAWRPSLTAYWRAGGRLIEVWNGETLSMMRADGTGRRPIAPYHEAGLGEASLSPSGRLVAITDATSSPGRRARRCAFNVGNCDEALVVLKRAGGKTIKRFRWRTGPSSGVYSLAWAPDERAVAVVALPFDQERMFVVDLRTGVRSLSRVRSRVDESPAWSPDGRRIAFISCHSKTLKCHLAVMGRDGSRRRVVRNIDPQGLAQPVWSPDGRAIALALPFGPEEESATIPAPQRYGIYRVRPDGSGFRRIAVTKPTQESPPLAWSRNSRRVAFSDTSGIWIASVRSRTKRRLTWMSGGEDTLSTVSWTPSARILFIHRGDVYAVLPGRWPVQLTK